MTIDVVDLDFKTLNFSRSYDARRYQRGKDLYKTGSVQVKDVNKINDKDYEIDATVDGNYGVYKVGLYIEGATITGSKCTCEDYRGGYLCKHIIATSMEVIDPHYASTEAGRKELERIQKQEQLKREEEARIRREQARKEQI